MFIKRPQFMFEADNPYKDLQNADGGDWQFVPTVKNNRITQFSLYPVENEADAAEYSAIPIMPENIFESAGAADSNIDNNPMISRCDIRIAYVGQNRNNMMIDKSMMINLSRTVPGSPILGLYNEDKKDFEDHGVEVVINKKGIHFNRLTKPYGFIDPYALTWFEEYDGKEYLMASGWLWTGRYPEAAQILMEGQKSVSMELCDDDSFQGYFDGEIFIVTDAMFSGICVLGDDVEPAFESAALFSLKDATDQKIVQTLFEMSKELKEFKKKEDNSIMPTDNTKEKQQLADNAVAAENETPSTDFASNKKTDEESNADEKQKEVKDDKAEKEQINEKEDKEKQEEKEDKKKAKADSSVESDERITALMSKMEALSKQMSSLAEENKSLRAFKEQAEDAEKMALITSFSMLSDEDKKDIIANRANFSLHEIKSELAIMCVDKKLNLSEAESAATKDFNLNIGNGSTVDSMPDWMNAVIETQKKMMG